MSAADRVGRFLRTRAGLVTRAVAGAASVAVGGSLVILTIALGSCDAFGGGETCAGLRGDVFGSAAAGAAIAVGIPMLAARPTKGGSIRAGIAAAGAGVVVGLLALALTA